MEIKQTYSSIDLLKFILSFLVVAIHSRPFFGSEADYYFTCFCRIAVPFFFIATSYFFFKKDSPDIKKYNKRLLTLYVLWFIIELPIVYYRFFLIVDYPFYLQILNLIRCLIFSNTWGASWFIMASLLSVNIVFYLSKRISSKMIFVIAVIAYIISLLSSSYNGIFNLFLNEDLQYYHYIFSKVFMPANSFIVAMIYIVLGKFLTERPFWEWYKMKKLSTTIAIFILVSFLGAIEVYSIKWSVAINDTFLFLPLFTFILFLIMLQTSISISPIRSKWFRNMSILIYILHPIVIYFNTGVLKIYRGGWLFCITLIGSFVIASFILKISQKLPALKNLY